MFKLFSYLHYHNKPLFSAIPRLIPHWWGIEKETNLSLPHSLGELAKKDNYLLKNNMEKVHYTALDDNIGK